VRVPVPRPRGWRLSYFKAAPSLMAFSGKRLLSGALLLLATLVCHVPVGTAEDLPSAQSVRAAMVFNFLKFTEFPPERTGNASRLRLCTAVRDRLQAEALFVLSGRKVGGREVEVTDFATPGSDCDVLYVDSPRQWNALEGRQGLSNTLTISSYPGFVREGGMIEIAVHKEGIQFDINLVEGRRAGLHFSPYLLRLARRVHE